MFRRGGAEIEEEIPVRVSSSVRETFLHKFDLSRKLLLRQMHHLRLVPGVLKKYHVVRVERNGPKLFGIQKKRFCTMKTTDMFLWCDPLVNALVRRLSLEHSSIRSSTTTKLFTLGSTRAFKSDGETFNESNIWNRSFQFVVSILVFSSKATGSDPEVCRRRIRLRESAV